MAGTIRHPWRVMAPEGPGDRGKRAGGAPWMAGDARALVGLVAHQAAQWRTEATTNASTATGDFSF